MLWVHKGYKFNSNIIMPYLVGGIIYIKRISYSWKNSKNLGSVLNEAKQIIMSDLHSGYIHNFYHDKQESIDNLFVNTLNPY